MTQSDPLSPPLDRLNPTERELLIMLGRGHTAKSISNHKGLSIAAVNERFRSARRKTGLASSREIARMLVAQENRHDLIDLVSDGVTSTILVYPDVAPSKRAFFTARWRPMMITATLFSAALLAYGTATPPAAPSHQNASADSKLVSELLAGIPPSPDIAALHAEASMPSTDAAWSHETEGLLSQRYQQLPDFNEAVQELNVTCATALCEAVGRFRSDRSQDRMQGFMEGVQGLGRSEPQFRLDQIVNHFSTSSSDPSSGVFVTYWRRHGN